MMKQNHKTLTSKYIRSLLLPRKKDSHKGDFGHVLVVAGSKGMSGAAVLSTHGALRSGAGLVTLAVADKNSRSMACRLRPEAMTFSLPGGRQGGFSSASVPGIARYIKERHITALVVGPGIGTNSSARSLVKELLHAIDNVVVLDADGISVLAAENNSKDFVIPSLARSRSRIIITPHPGELARLLRRPAAADDREREALALECARANGVVCVLKGYKTVISDGKNVYINPTGNPGMASGGAGDVLSGMIAALRAQVIEPAALNAALCGVYLHGLSGDLAAKGIAPVGFLSGDVAEMIPRALREIL